MRGFSFNAGEIPFETIANAVEIAKKSQAKVVFDPAPAKESLKIYFHI